jgi:hypothetical protein
MHLMQKDLAVIAEIALPVWKMLVSKMSHCRVRPRPFLDALVYWERPITEALETNDWFLSVGLFAILLPDMNDMLPGFLQGIT